MRWVRGREILDAGTYGFLPTDIAAQLGLDRRALLALNPTRAPRTVWTGHVVLRELPPYRPDPDDGLCGDRPCPDGGR